MSGYLNIMHNSCGTVFNDKLILLYQYVGVWMPVGILAAKPGSQALSHPFNVGCIKAFSVQHRKPGKGHGDEVASSGQCDHAGTRPWG